MPEFTKPFTRDGVLGVIRSKAWYGLDPTTGAFNWQMSVNNIGQELGLDPSSVNSAIARAFTPNCLSRVSITNKPLLASLQDIGVHPHAWTVGDEDWQRTKFVNSGAIKYVDDAHYHSVELNKIKELRKIVDSLITQNVRTIVVADDKESNIVDVKQLALEYRNRSVLIMDYLMKLSNPLADATAFYVWFKQLMHDRSNEQIGLILDYDGVIADTDGVLFGPAVDNLWGLFNR